MFADRKLSNSNQCAFRMPHSVVENERYMNDSTDAVFKKYSSATKFKKTAKFVGGIWDLNDDDMVTQPCEPNPVDFLLNIISNGNDEREEEMEEEETDYVAKKSLNAFPEASKDSYPNEEFLTKNKRGMIEELDKTVVISDKKTAKETSRKRTKKTNSPVKNESPETKHKSVVSRSHQLEQASTADGSFEMKDDTDITKIDLGWNTDEVDDRMDLKLQSNGREIVYPTKENNIVVESQLSSKEASHMQKKNNEDGPKKVIKLLKSYPKNATVLKEVTNNSYPEDNILEYNDLKKTCKTRNLHVSVKTEIKKKALNVRAEESNNDHMNTMQISDLKNSSEIKSPVNETTSVNEPECSTFEMNSCNGKTKLLDSNVLKNIISELLGDDEFLTVKKVETSHKASNLVHKGTKKTSNESPKDPTAKVELLQEVLTSEEHCCHGEQSEDKSQIVKLKLGKKEIDSLSQINLAAPPVLDDVIKSKQKINEPEKVTKQANVIDSSDKIIYQLNEKHSDNFFPGPKNQASSNWRRDCIDVRQSSNKLNKGNLKTSASNSCNWRDHCIDSKKSEGEFEEKISTFYSFRRRGKYGSEKLNDQKEFIPPKEMEDDLKTLSDEEEEKWEQAIIIALQNMKEPEPLSRFQGIGNPDPESIWDLTEPNKASFQILKNSEKKKCFETNEKTEEIHTQFSNKMKKIKIPDFFGTPSSSFSKNSLKTYSENVKLPQREKFKVMPSDLETKSNDSRSSRSHNNAFSKKSERNRSASVNWRNPTSFNNYSDYNDDIIIVTVTDEQGNVVEEIKTRKYELLELKKEFKKLFHLIPDPNEIDRHVSYSAPAVKVFLRSLFFLSSCQTERILSDWKIALEAYAIAKKFNVSYFEKECRDYFAIQDLPSKQINKIAEVAKCFNVIEALQSAEIFPEVLRSAESMEYSSSAHKNGCVVSCTTYIRPSELSIPLHYENDRCIEGTNNCDLQNTIKIKCVSGVISIMGIQLKLQTDDSSSKNKELRIFCDVFKNKNKMFGDDQELKEAHLPLKIPFGKGLSLKAGEEFVIEVSIDDISLRMCSQLKEESIVHGKFQAFFRSGKTSMNKKPLFFIEKLFYK
ncbi:uncharacterized protein NPIL_242931 [Nephila pilipes]|uniref:Uncharacterized protein n=1 Tax=Nephila pilipes TaxID=299642 RepID=A0A8X6MZW0_NEPPI|nr:uncharacterized protein NPIL_242931 [Nephila pilipes]